ncbi:MTERFD1 [Symbiodinium sp. CCMP2592]|nr:MTERFD1 [Symbiodinium sp. CCMP2592]
MAGIRDDAPAKLSLELDVTPPPPQLPRRLKRLRRLTEEEPEEVPEDCKQAPAKLGCGQEEPFAEPAEPAAEVAAEAAAGPRRSQRLRDRALRARANEPEQREVRPQAEASPERPPPRQTRQSRFDDEESDEEDAQEFAECLRGSQSGGSSRASRSLGSDEDPEVSTWRDDLAGRWADTRPSAAFSLAFLDGARIRALPAKCRLAGYPIFDPAGKVNLPLLLGAHKQLLAQGSSSSEARQVGWLARQALALELIDDSQLKRGRLVVLGKGPARKKAKLTTLVPLQEIKWPQKKKATKAPRRKPDGALFSEDEDSEDSELQRAVEQESLLQKLREQLRESMKKSEARRLQASSASVDIKKVKEAALAPRLSFDLYAPEEDDPDADVLEVLPPEGVCRGSLLREEVQRQLFAAAAKALVVEEPKKEPAAAPEADGAGGAPEVPEASSSKVQEQQPTKLEASLPRSAGAPKQSSPTKGRGLVPEASLPRSEGAPKQSSPTKGRGLVPEESRGSVSSRSVTSSFFRPDSEEEDPPEEEEEASLSESSDLQDMVTMNLKKRRRPTKEALQYREEWAQKLRDAKILGKEYLDSVLSKEDFIKAQKAKYKPQAKAQDDRRSMASEKAVLWLRGDEDDFEDLFRGLRPKKEKKPSFLSDYRPPPVKQRK